MSLLLLLRASGAPGSASGDFRPGAFTMGAAEREQAAAAALQPAPFTLGAAVLGGIRAAAALQPTPFTLGATAAVIDRASGSLRPAPFTLAAAAALPPAAAAALMPAPFTLDAAVVMTPSAAATLIPGPFSLTAAEQEQAAAASLRPAAFRLGGAAIYHYPHVGALAVTGVSPDFGATLGFVSITGAGFNGATRVSFGSAGDALLVTVIADTQIQALAPFAPFYGDGGNHDDLTVDVRVFTVDDPGGSPVTRPVSTADTYTFLAPPVLSTVTPGTGSTTANTPVIVTGKNLRHVFALYLGPLLIASVSPTDVSADGTIIALTLDTAGFTALGGGVYELRAENPALFSDYHNPSFALFDAALVPDPTPAAALDAMAGRHGAVAWAFRFELRDRSNVFIQDITTAVRVDGTALHLDNTAAVARTLDILFEGAALPAGFDAGESTQHAVAVFMDLRVRGTTYSWQRGLFHLDRPARDQYPNDWEAWTAKGADMTVVLAVHTTRATYTVPAFSVYLDVIRGICAGFNLVTDFPRLSLVTAPVDLTWPGGTPWLQIVNDLLYGMNFYPAWADASGRITSRVRIDPALEPAQAAYDTSVEPRMLVGDLDTPSVVTFDVTQLWNWVNVAIDDPSRDGYVASQSNNDPTAPASIPASGKLVFQAISGSSTPSTRAIPSPQLADAIAAFEVRDQNTRAVTRTITTQPDPRRTNRESYRLTLAGYETDTLWRGRGWDQDCSPGGLMTHTLELAQEFSVTGVLPNASVVQVIGTLGLGAGDGIVPGQGAILDAQLPVTRATVPGDAVLAAILTDQTFQPFWTLQDSAGNSYTIVELLGGAGFGDAQPGGNFTVRLAYAQNAQPLGPGDTIDLGFGVGAHQLAMAAFELSGIGASFFDTPEGITTPLGSWAKATASAPGNTLSLADAGAAAVIANAYDLIVGVVGAMWNATAFDGGPDPGYSVTPDSGDGWEGAQAVTVTTQPVNGLYAMLAVYLRVGLTPETAYTIKGTLSAPAAGWGAAAVPLQGNQGV